MPLCWTTKEILGGKYRLKKPIPVESFSANWVGSGEIEIWGKDFNDITGPVDDDIIKEINEILSGKRDYNQYSRPDYARDLDREFLEKLMPYLTEEYDRFSFSGVVSEKLGKRVYG